MPKLVLPEELLRAIQHPERLYGRSLVHHEFNDRLQFGYGTFHGDPHLALYVDSRRNRWEIYRFELDGKYHCAARSPSGALLGEDTWNKLAAHLQAHDARNGYDAAADVVAHEAALERANDRDFADKIADIADTYLFPAYKKVGFDNYL